MTEQQAFRKLGIFQVNLLLIIAFGVGLENVQRLKNNHFLKREISYVTYRILNTISTINYVFYDIIFHL